MPEQDLRWSTYVIFTTRSNLNKINPKLSRIRQGIYIYRRFLYDIQNLTALTRLRTVFDIFRYLTYIYTYIVTPEA